MEVRRLPQTMYGAWNAPPRKLPERKGSDMPAPRTGGSEQPRKHDNDNRANQLNPNHTAYWQSRGEDKRPSDWERRVHSGQED